MFEETIDLDQIIPQQLTLFCFQNIWNEIGSELRNNVIPQMLYERSQTGNIFIGSNTIPLPDDKKSYYVYAVSRHTTYALAWPKVLDHKWINCEDLVNEYSILFHAYHTTGLMLHKKFVHVFKMESGIGFLVAIEREMATSMLQHKDMKDIYFTLYYDSDITNKIEVLSYKIPYRDDGYVYRKQVYDFIAAKDSSISTVFINGYETKITGMGSFPLNAYIDVIRDENVIFSFDVDLTVTEENHMFYSDKDKTYKQLVHIPKALNPTNKVLTHNTMDIFVRRKEKVNQDIDGLYLHRCAERSVSQVTHNDIAIPMFIVDAYRDYLDTQDITLHVIVRQHAKDNVLIRDKNYIDFLYVLDDATIIEHLLGRVDETLSFWKASELEKSKYIEMMFDIPEIITSTSMTEYVEGLGYYHTIALLCKRVQHTVITEWFTGTLGFQKPYVFQNDYLFPVVYLNGKKVKYDQVVYDNLSQQMLSVGFTDDVKYQLGDIMSVEMFLDGYKDIYRMQVTKTNTTIEIPYNNIDILEEIDNSPIVTKQFDKSTTKGYVPFTDTTGNLVIKKLENGKWQLTFGPMLYNKTFIIQNRTRVYTFSKDLDEDLIAGNPIYLPIEYNIKGSPEKAPIYYTPHITVYLNGKYLVEHVDFTVHEVHDYEDNFCFKIIAIENVEYLQSSDNKVEWMIASAEVDNSNYGFVLDNRAYTPGDLSLYFENMSMVHVDGTLEWDITDMGNYLLLPTASSYRQGALFEIHTCIPRIVKDYLDKYHVNDDLERLAILNKYFFGKEPVPEFPVVAHKHRVYSIYLATLIRDILDGTLAGLSYDPDEKRMLEQVKDYEYLELADPVIQDKYDLRFIGTYPHYKDITIPDIDTYNVIQGFIRIMMPTTNYSDSLEMHPDESELKHYEDLVNTKKK